MTGGVELRKELPLEDIPFAEQPSLSESFGKGSQRADILRVSLCKTWIVEHQRLNKAVVVGILVGAEFPINEEPLYP